MNLSRLDVPQSFAARSRVFFKPDVLSEVTGRQSLRLIHCSSVSARDPANQSSRGSVAGLRAVQPRSGVAPRASSVTGASHQRPMCRQLRYSSHSQSVSARR